MTIALDLIAQQDNFVFNSIKNMDLPYLENNVHALEKFEQMFPDTNIREKFLDNPSQTIYDLRTICGLKCAKCGGYVTGPNLKFFNFEADTRCYNCQ